MITTGKITLYITKNKESRWEVSNWPGSLRLPVVTYKEGHSRAFGKLIPRMDVWFKFEGKTWHGVNTGDNEVLYCKRNKN